MKHNICVRNASAELCPGLGQIMAASFRAAFGGFISQETLERCAVAENCAALLAGLPPEMTTLAGWLDGRLMGLLVYTERPDGRTELEAIHSLPESWGTGLGAAMLEAALAQTGAREAVGLWAFAQNHRARRFYEKQGFRFTGETRISEFDGAAEVRYERNFA